MSIKETELLYLKTISAEVAIFLEILLFTLFRSMLYKGARNWFERLE